MLNVNGGPMRFIILLLSMAATCHAGTIARLTYQIRAEKPLPIELPLRFGETVDVDVQFSNYGTAMDLTDATVILHATTNNMPAGYSFQASGTPGRFGIPSDALNGWATVRLDVDSLCPADQTTMPFVLAVSKDGKSLLRASGSIRLTGTPAGTMAAPQLSLPFDSLGSSASVSNSLASALQAEINARIALGIAQSNATEIASTNLQAALNYMATAASNYADRVAASASGSTNAAHVSETDPHGDRAYSDGLMATGTAARATYATTAGTVTGAQSNDLAGAKAHTNRTDNPHGVTAAQLGAVSGAGATNIVLSIHTPSTNAIWNAIAGAPRWPTYDWGTHSNVVFVLSNSVLYLLNN